MITILVIILLVLLLAGGGWGVQTGYVTANNPVGIILFIVVILVVLSLLAGPVFHRPIW